MEDPKYCFRCDDVITSKYGKKFCSVRCSALYASVLGGEATKVDKSYKCEECGIVYQRLDSRGRFCSHSCSAKFTNRQRYPNQKRPCANCPPVSNGIRDGKRKYVRKACSWQCKRSSRINDWLAGKIDFVSKYGTSPILRDYLLDKHEHKCQDCGYDNVRLDGASILQVHHIDGSWDNCRPENLRLLCPNCHALTENYGARNKGKGRKWKASYRYNGSVEKFATVV